MNGLKVSMLVGAMGLGLAGGAQAALVGSNLSFEDDGVMFFPAGATGATGWTQLTDTGGDLVPFNVRTATDPDNWFPDSTAGNHVLILESTAGTVGTGVLAQQLTGTAEAGTYTFSIADVGVANFADNNNRVITYGFSLDGVNVIAGSSQTLTEGSEISSPDNGGGPFAGSVQYTADGTEAQLWLILSMDTGFTGRSAATIGSTDLTFVPEPGSLALLGLGGLALLRRRRA